AGVVEAAGPGEAAVEVLEVIELGEVLGRRDQRQVEVQAAGGLAYVHQLDAIGAGGHLAVVAERVVVAGQVEIVAGGVAEHRGGRRDPGVDGGGLGGECRGQGQGQK